MKLIKHKKISKDEAQELTKNFIRSLKKEVEMIETWAWFDIDELFEYLDEAKSKTDSGKLSGLRIYLGKYSGKKNNGAFTVYLAPTETIIDKGKTPKDSDIKMEALNLGGTGIEKV
jgi:hypothetical protein